MEVIVRLKVRSLKHTPSAVTEIVGIPSDKSWNIGDKRGRSSIVEKDHGWLVHSGVERTAPLRAHLDALFSVILPHAAKFNELATDDDIEFSVVVYGPSQPELYFSKEDLNAIVRLGASLDIDYYFVPDVEGT